MDQKKIDAVKKKLKELEAIWPKGLMLVNSSNHLVLVCGHPNDGGKALEDYGGIPCDGGDFDWTH